MSSVNRYFLGWDQPFLPAAANWLQKNHLPQDLGHAKEIIVLVSSRGVGRRLKSLLVNQTTAIDLPEILTPSGFLDRLTGIRNRVASTMLLHMTTAVVLREDVTVRSLDTNQLSHEDIGQWFSLAKEVNEIGTELALGGLTADPSSWPHKVASQSLLTDKSHDYFARIAKVREIVSNTLAQDGYMIKDQQWLELLDHVHSLPKQIILLGASDLPEIVHKVLSTVSEQGVSVDVLIRAPEEKSELFDTLGCVIPNQWKEYEIQIPDENIEVAGSVSSQANKLVHSIASLGQISKDDITIAITDRESIPLIQRQLDGYSIETRYAGGKSAMQSSAVKLLMAIGEFAKTRSFSSYASLVRHPKVVRMLAITGSDLHYLDQYCNDHSLHEIGDVWITPEPRNKKYANNDALVELHNKVMTLVEPLINDLKQDVAAWSLQIRRLFLTMYGDDELDTQSHHLAALEFIFKALDKLDSLPKRLRESIGDTSASQIFELLFEELVGDSIPEYPNPNAIEVVEWLEALQDDAPYLFVVGMDTSLVTASMKKTAFLPDRLRQALRLETADRKLARDAHAMTAMQCSRKDHGHLGWIVARKNLTGDPLMPNPLLLRCNDDEILANRIMRLVVDVGDESPDVPPKFGVQVSPETPTSVDIPNPNVLSITHKPCIKMNVTSFKDHIACPYRFWLRHVLKLREACDGKSELDHGDFGSLVHRVLQRFGHDESAKKSSDVETISTFLSKALDVEVERSFGKNPLPTVLLQAEIARQRLKSFAAIQAVEVAHGWNIVEAEKEVDLDFGTEEAPFIVRGIIDRIDVHESGNVRVLDYKTGSNSAREDHGTRNEWRNLQLPIYRLLAEAEGYELENINVGYIMIGSTDNNVKFDFPEWDDAWLQEADDLFRRIVEQVRNGEFAPQPVARTPRYAEDLSWICQDSGIIDSEGEDFDG